jgi:hypothetical protein
MWIMSKTWALVIQESGLVRTSEVDASATGMGNPNEEPVLVLYVRLGVGHVGDNLTKDFE